MWVERALERSRSQWRDHGGKPALPAGTPKAAEGRPPSRLVFLVPASGIPVGEYVRIMLVTQYSDGRRELKTPRTYECPIYLDVLAG